MKPNLTRCAIYTRKSCEEGLEQEFNSLDAQREASEAYVKSQKHEGWEIVPSVYDDGGFSGGNMERPALRRLMADIEAGKVDVVVVYKVDRLSRALSDFAKMVDVFDQRNVSFVSVTQQFNTTTSMGRLTLNVLLSFAQFEREVTGERIRDKFAASKKKGMWMGGPQPLGYDVIERKLIINTTEAEMIKFIYEYYARKPESQPVYNLLDELKAKGYKGKSYVTQKGKQITGKELSLSRIYTILNNPVYNGKITHKDKVYEGEHKAIIGDLLWNKVQSKMNKPEFVKNINKKSEQPKLAGKVFDYLGNKLTATYSYKYSVNGRYKMRYYINRQIISKGKSESEFKRIRVEYIDDVVKKEVFRLLQLLIIGVVKSNNNDLSSLILKPLKNLLDNPIGFLSKITLFPKHMELLLQLPGSEKAFSDTSIAEIRRMLASYKPEVSSSTESALSVKLSINAQYKRTSGQLHITTENGGKVELEIEAQYMHPNDKTFAMVAKSFYWDKQIKNGLYKTPTEISKFENHNIKYVKRAIRQRFLSPEIIKTLTSTDSNFSQNKISIDNLSGISHWCWRRQEEALLN